RSPSDRLVHGSTTAHDGESLGRWRGVAKRGHHKTRRHRHAAEYAYWLWGTAPGRCGPSSHESQRCTRVSGVSRIRSGRGRSGSGRLHSGYGSPGAPEGTTSVQKILIANRGEIA